ELYAGCECGQQRSLYEASQISTLALGHCQGKRPWLGHFASEQCGQPYRLLMRTASNAYFSQTMSVISLPDHDEALASKIASVWDVLEAVKDAATLAVYRHIPKVKAALEGLTDEQ